MWFPKSLSALWLASCVMAAEDTPGAKLSEDGIRSIQLRTHSLNQPYLDSDMQSRWFDFGGHTIVRADRYIRLTSDYPSSSGWLFSRVPLTATNWEIEFEFKIHGQGNLHGDGFAMWLTKQRGIQGDVFGSVDKFEGLGIFFDTYKNNRPGTVFPYVMAMVGDGNTAYDKNNDGKDQEFMGCPARGIRNANMPTKAKLTYFQDKSLKLELQYKAEDQWELCFHTFSPPSIPAVAYLGFSAETGELSDNHDIISVTTNNLYDTNTHKNKDKDAQPIPESGSSRSPKGQDNYDRKKPEGSWSWFFVKCFLGLVVLAGVYIGYTAWRTQQRRSHRF